MLTPDARLLAFRNKIESDACSCHEWPHGLHNLHTHTHVSGGIFFALAVNGTCGCRPFAKTEEAHGGILKPLSIRLCVCE